MKATSPIPFLTRLFKQSKAPVFVTSLANNKNEGRQYPPRWIMTRTAEEVERFAAKWDVPGRALYFCVGTLKPGAPRRCKETLSELVGAHVDIDFKDITDKPAVVRRVLTELKFSPSVVNHSGHGLHAYWILRQPMPATPRNIERLEVVLQHLAGVLVGDRHVAQAAALLRLPGSHNSKAGDWLEVRTLTPLRSVTYYLFSQLEHWAFTLKAPLLNCRERAKSTAAVDPWLALAEEQSFRAPIDVERRLADMYFHGHDEDGVHATQLSVTAALLQRGFTVDHVVSKVLQATVEAAGLEGRGWDWHHEKRELRKMCASWREKHPRIYFERPE
jgi:hypothetical protein